MLNDLENKKENKTEKKTNYAALVAAAIAFFGLLGAMFTWVHSELKTLTALEAIERVRDPWLNRWLKSQEKIQGARANRIDRLETRIRRLESLHFKNDMGNNSIGD